MDMTLNLIVLKQKRRARERRVTVGRNANHRIPHPKQTPSSPKLHMKSSSPLGSFSRAAETETACSPATQRDSRHKHFSGLGKKIVNFAVLNTLVLGVKWI